VLVLVEKMTARDVAFVSSFECTVHPKLLPAACVRTSDARPAKEIVVTPAEATVKAVLETSPLMLGLLVTE
jgi:hypothetical protein